MKKIIYCFFFILLSIPGFSQTQLEMNEAENKRFLKADKELNQVYQQILKEYKQDTAFIRNLKASQRLWVQFRDAEVKMMYPDREPGYYGSIHPMCWSIYKTELTSERVKKLRQWLSGQEEGDSCSSSIKLKE
jgi:uncharacterized protein YecT (DUF1311 family)